LAPKITKKKATLKITIVPPAGKFNRKEKIIPLITEKMEIAAEIIIVVLKLKESCSAVSGGIISNAETNIIPVTFIAKTAATAVNNKRMILILFVLMPMLLASSSSKVTANRSL
jgi:hypothetical protein